MRHFSIVLWRELLSSFSHRTTQVCVLLFPALAASLAFYVGNFYQNNQATLGSFFVFHPWCFLFLMPLLTMDMWKKKCTFGAIELLMTLPISLFELGAAKFFCSWFIAASMLFFTLPMVWTVNYLGNPDNGAIAVGYLGSWLLAGVFLAVGSCMSALLSSRLGAYTFTVILCFMLLACGIPMVTENIFSWMDSNSIEAMSELGLLNFFERAVLGVLSVKELLCVMSLIIAWFIASIAILKIKKRA